MPLTAKELEDCKPKRLWSDTRCEWIEVPKKPKRGASQEELQEYQEIKYCFQALLEKTTWYFEKQEQLRISRSLSNSNNSHKRRIRVEKTFIEKVDSMKVFNRDNWICQLCNYPVSKLMDKRLVDIASLDHIIPISKGGEHSYANTQLAHLSCNIRKGNRV
jgi:5-methylcytosine-specific restriction endonuclease McrA